ncbi:dihydropteroate synthase [Anaerotalea alkaliphila]|uniref:Dihydropteroate synthase n=1 Tax=Anaerotalea alkaliphila TaxID=2662126 RepID=A0A7X5HTU0_9FIRM|nr:dihydropteroate synthase [Anaerotalea alkaliphila]NDL66547.1 dihydropteroate synthase [Anaerotalea alkaliphila]
MTEGKPWKLKRTDRALVMGILNVTPDSFSDGGRFNRVEDAVARCMEMIGEGADIIDIGGESTRPGHSPLSEEEEIDRVVPVVEGIRRRTSHPLSIDTSKAAVAEAAILAGADMVNDVWGFKRDKEMARVCARHRVVCCLMHNREPEGLDVYRNLEPQAYVELVCRELLESLSIAREAGIREEDILLDPGVGFAKTREQNLLVMKHLDRFVAMGHPVLLGTSRKSVIGLTLDLPVDQRLEGTLATTVLGRMSGCTVFRVHDVKENVRALRMTEAVLAAGSGGESGSHGG